jgi:hypothetical protein
MPWILGTDEAGYGPNLGPLVISGVLLEVPDGWDADSLYEQLAECVSDNVSDRTRCVFTDSKLLYKPGQGLGRLEENVLATAAILHPQAITDWQSFWDNITTATAQQRAELPWYANFNVDLPLAATSARVSELSRVLSDGLERVDAKLVSVRVRSMLTPEFNRQLDALGEHGVVGSKGSVLTSTTLELIRSMIEPLPDGLVKVYCDKHGGRDRYMPALQTAFPDRLVEIKREGRALSEYHWGPPERRRQIQFAAKGDRLLPSALASLFAKYVRELAMLAFNTYWINLIPSLQRTAGYPQDAKRFRADIASKQSELEISDSILWRLK